MLPGLGYEAVSLDRLDKVAGHPQAEANRKADQRDSGLFPSASSRSSHAKRKPIFLAMQGGGAKGIVHVGALTAIEQLKFDIQGVAGTSAGSMVAALVAAGYKASELVDPQKKTHLFNTVGDALGFKEPTKLFATKGWMILKFARGVSSKLNWISGAFSATKNWVLGAKRTKAVVSPKTKLQWLRGAVVSFFSYLLRGLSLMVGILFLLSLIYFFVFYIPTITTICFAAVFFLVRWIIGGITSVGNIQYLMDRALAKKLTENGYVIEKDVTFEDLDAAKCIPLKIVATNVAYECLELFCLDRTPNVRVADAVAASVCLPFIFKPFNHTFQRQTELDSEKIVGQFLDGGLVSNLPAWPFDEERLLQPNVATVALSIESGKVEVGKHWMKSITGTVVNGASVVHTRATGSIIKVPLLTELDMLRFDVSAEDVYKIVSETAIEVNARLSLQMFEGVQLLENAVRNLNVWFKEEIEQGAAEWHRGHPKPKLRIAIAAERGGSMNSLSNVATFGYEDSDPDIRITRRHDCWMYREACEKIAPRIFDLSARVVGEVHVDGEKISLEAQWVACFPLCFPAGQGKRMRRCVVVVDSNVAIDQQIPLADKFLDKFVVDAFAHVTEYDLKHELMESLQGENTWL